MEPTIVECPEIKVVGVEIRTTNRDETQPSKAQIPGLWGRFLGERLAERIPNQRERGVLLATYTRYESDHTGPYSLILGAEVTTLDDVPEGMVGLTVHAARYLVFAAQGKMPEAIFMTWSLIWGYFSDTSRYQRAFTADFERHDTENPSRVDIHIAVR